MSTRKAIFALALCAGAGLFAQQVPAPPDTVQVKVLAEGAAGGVNTVVRFMSAEFGVAGKTVKGVPYQAQAVTETTQTLADGNRIVHKSTALLARDSEGRTRREQKIDSVGQWATGGQPSPLVFINDPVAQVIYILESNTKTARKMSASGEKSVADEAKIVAEKKALDARRSADVKGDIVKESLGSKTIEGTVAEGTRFTRTVAAGKMGNERPLTFVNETWFSSELGMIVMSRHTDPQMGETVYTLTNIQRSEPEASLFAVPSDYMKEGLGTITSDGHEN
jgi:hypothetical protein